MIIKFKFEGFKFDTSSFKGFFNSLGKIFVNGFNAIKNNIRTFYAELNTETLKEKLDKYNNWFSIALTKRVELMRLQYEKVMNSKVFKEPLLRIQDEYLKFKNFRDKKKRNKNKW
mgnify:CR=1 FL=1